MVAAEFKPDQKRGGRGIIEFVGKIPDADDALRLFGDSGQAPVQVKDQGMLQLLDEVVDISEVLVKSAACDFRFPACFYDGYFFPRFLVHEKQERGYNMTFGIFRLVCLL